MDRITDSIWIGNYLDAADRENLRAMGVRAVLCLDGCMSGKSVADVGVERVEVIELIDGAGNTPEKFMRAVRSLKELVSQYAPVLVHCHAGQSRSAAVVCKYLMKEEGKSLSEAMKQITSKRSVAIVKGLQEALDFN
jgi:dual specificity phosphatase 12